MRACTNELVSNDEPELDIDAIYRAYGHVVVRRAQALLSDEQEAIDVMHDVFESMMQEATRFQGRSSASTWLYRVTTNMCLNRLRDRRRRREILDTEAAPLAPAVQPEQATAWVQVRQLMERLPDDQLQAIVYCWIDGMTHDEIAEIMQCSRRHVHNLLRRAQAWSQNREDASCPQE
jgi:RNA polymerase sigma factor (sigma-70 family)